MKNNDFDVVVVGGGPAGSSAAKKCAEGGLKTLLLEKHQLPRNKVCTGMIMSKMAQSLVREEFGEPPVWVLTKPSHLRGLRFRAQGAQPLTFEWLIPFAWRKDFDYWLNQVAKERGTELWDRAEVKDISEDGNYYNLRIEKEGETLSVNARFLIGADGTTSVVRNALFPDVPMARQLCVRCYYQGSLDLEPDYAHYFYFQNLTGFEVNFKENIFLLEVTPNPTQKDGSDIIQEAEKWLAKDFGLTPGTKPFRRDGCVEPSMGRRSFSDSFQLAKANSLLVGNAAGLTKPITGEGIGTAIKSGCMAGEAVIQANKKGEKAETIYLPMAQEMVALLDRMVPPHGKVKEAARKGMDSFLGTVKQIFVETVDIL